MNLIHFSTNKAQNLNTEYEIKGKFDICNNKQECCITSSFVLIQAIGSYHIGIKNPSILIASLGVFLDKQGVSNRSNIEFLYQCQTDTMGKHCKQNSMFCIQESTFPRQRSIIYLRYYRYKPKLAVTKSPWNNWENSIKAPNYHSLS